MDRRVAEATKSCQSGERARVDTSYRDKLVETHNQKELDLELDECCCQLREAELYVLDFYI